MKSISTRKARPARSTRQHGGLVALAGLTVTGLVLAACGSSSGTSGSTASGSPAGAAKITLKVQDFGLFGYKDLYAKYMADHPNITIVEQAEGDLGKYNSPHPADRRRQRRGRRRRDRGGPIVNFLQSPDKFVNFQNYGVATT